MDVLPFHFRVFQFCGIWDESDEKSGLLKFMYKILVILSVLLFTLGQLIELIIVSIDGDMKDLTESLFLSLTCLILCFKLINFIYRQNDIKEVLNNLKIQICQPRDFEEKTKIIESQKKGFKFTIIILGVALATDVVFLLVPLVNLITTGKMKLPVRTYHPYALNDVNYAITIVVQFLCLTYSVLLNVTLDMLPSVFMLYTYGQFEVCSYRFFQSKKEDIVEATKTCVNHQVLLRKVVKAIESIFMDVVLLLFLVQMLVLCISIFKLSQTNFRSIEFLQLIMYLMCMLNQLFFYCWSGNELTVKSTNIVNAMYEYNWIELKPTNRKNMLLVMIMSQKEIDISKHGLCALSLQTFVWIVKTSFTAYNLLQSVTENE